MTRALLLCAVLLAGCSKSKEPSGYRTYAHINSGHDNTAFGDAAATSLFAATSECEKMGYALGVKAGEGADPAKVAQLKTELDSICSTGKPS